MPAGPIAVFLRCPECMRDYRRIYKEHDNGFGFCVDHPTVRVVRAGKLKDDAKLAKIRAELSGKMVYSNSSGRLIT